MAKKYNEVTPEILEQFKAIVPGKVYAGEEINSDYFHDEMPIYGKGAPEVVIEATTTEDIAAIVKRMPTPTSKHKISTSKPA